MEFEFDDRSYCFSVDYNTTPQPSAFDILLKSEWSKASENGLFRYQLPDLNTAVLPGKYGFVMQLNPQRAEQRRKPQNLSTVNPSFDPTQFNFTKIQDKEILIKLKWSLSHSNENLIIINVSPLEFGNSLLVPFREACIPQRITQDGLSLAIKILLLNNNLNFRIGFNSPGACCSVNHQHFHMYYLRQRLFIETAELRCIASPCYTLKDFPSNGFVFQLEDENISELVQNIVKLVSYMQQNEIPHNLFMTRGTSYRKTVIGSYDTIRIFIWPRQPLFGVKEDFGFNPACCELSGHFLGKNVNFYKTATEIQLANILTELTAPYFEKISGEIHQMYQ